MFSLLLSVLKFQFLHEQKLLFEFVFVVYESLAETFSFFQFILVNQDVFLQERNLFLHEELLFSRFLKLIFKLVYLSVEKFILIDLALVLYAEFADIIVCLAL